MHCIASNSCEIPNDESKSTIYITCLTRDTSAWLCDVQCTCVVTLFRAKSSYSDPLYATMLNNIWYFNGKKNGSSSDGDRKQAPHTGCYKLTSRNSTYGEAIRFIAECGHRCSFSNSQWSSRGLCVGRARPEFQGPSVTETFKQHSMAWRFYSSASVRKAWWRVWYA